MLKLSILSSDVLIIFGYCCIDQCFVHFEQYLLSQLQQTQLKEKPLLENRDIQLGSIKDKTRRSNLPVTSKSNQGRKTWNLADTRSEKQRAYSVVIYEQPGKTFQLFEMFFTTVWFCVYKSAFKAQFLSPKSIDLRWQKRLKSGTSNLVVRKLCIFL